MAIPALVVLLAINHAGGSAFAALLAALGALGHVELARLARLPARVAAPGAAAVAAGPPLALAGAPALLAAAGAVGVTVAAAAAAGGRGRAAAVTAGGVAWLGGTLAVAMLLRELDHGAAWVILVLAATFVGDTAAQLAGTAYGRHRLAAAISPHKTVEGLLAGVVCGTLACWLIARYADPWIGGLEALGLGFACALAAPAGDLLESAVKRRAGVKDSGRLFGAHGGVLDRIDAAVAAALAGYLVATAVS